MVRCLGVGFSVKKRRYQSYIKVGEKKNLYEFRFKFRFKIKQFLVDNAETRSAKRQQQQQLR